MLARGECDFWARYFREDGLEVDGRFVDLGEYGLGDSAPLWVLALTATPSCWAWLAWNTDSIACCDVGLLLWMLAKLGVKDLVLPHWVNVTTCLLVSWHVEFKLFWIRWRLLAPTHGRQSGQHRAVLYCVEAITHAHRVSAIIAYTTNLLGALVPFIPMPMRLDWGELGLRGCPVRLADQIVEKEIVHQVLAIG